MANKTNKFSKQIENNSSKEILNAGKVEGPVETETISIIKEPENNEINLDDLINITAKIKYKNKSYYLEEDVINQLSKLAKSRKMSDSSLINTILKKVLNI